MQVSAVLLARVIYFVESVDLNPRGSTFYPDLIKALVERYRFGSYPQRLEDFDEKKGVILAAGRMGDTTIDKVVIYNWGVSLETSSSTADAERLLNDALIWGSEAQHLHYDPAMIRRKSYVSHLTFYSNIPLLSLNPVLGAISERIDRSVTTALNLPYKFQPTGILLGIDPETQVIPVQRFSIERREGIAFSENKYFSAAPVATDLHMQLITDYERSMQATNTAARR